MKALEAQVPDRYFDLLPNRIMARLEETMQSSDVNRPRGPQTNPKQAIPSAGSTRERDTDKVEPRQEDSGLSDIRAMARTTKQRISAQRISQRRIPTNPPDDEDILATSSSSLRAVALPVAGLPAQPETVGNGTGPSTAIPAPAATAKPAATTASPITPLPQKKKSKAPLIAAGATAAALAAGVAGYVVLRQQNDNSAGEANNRIVTTPLTEKKEEAAVPAAMPSTPEPPAAAQAPVPAPAMDVTGKALIPAENSGAAAAAGSGMLGKEKGDEGYDGDEAAKAKDHKQHERGDKDRDKKDSGSDAKKPEKAPTSSSDTKKPGPADKQGESLDDLLRGAGVDPDANKKQQAPKLDKKELTAADIRTAMSALNGKAQACYAKYGVSGSVAVKLMVAPSGEVKKASVTGSFAGTPTGDCVQKVAGGAKFPAWDGNALTVNYSYFLSE